MIRTLCVLLTCAALPVAAQDAFLDWPVDCDLGKTCFVEDYVDTNPAPKQTADFTCGLNTRDGHKGTDIALLDFADVDRGVAVLAAAAGRVLRTRDEMPDDRRQPGVTSTNACGNAVLIDHGNGYRTQYCHLKLGSVAVAPGDAVQSGDRLGDVGLSGRTTHPHLHMTVLQGSTVVDPFSPTKADTCGPSDVSLWTADIPYHKTILRLAGFSNGVPDYTALRGGTARINTSRADAPLVVYAEAGFAEHGDVLTITATGPQGEAFNQTRVMKSPRTSQLPAYGKNAPAGGWPRGDYTGQITLTRAGEVIANRWAHVVVE